MQWWKKQESPCFSCGECQTSQNCPKCGHTEKANRDKRRHLFCCKNCGYKSNDDRIGAMNLYRMGINLLVPDTAATE